MIVIGNSANFAASVCILVLLFCMISRISGEYESREVTNGGSNDRSPGNEFGSCTDGKCIKRTTQEITNGMWFGPRLGRRRRSEEKLEMDQEIEALINALDSVRWALITIPANEKRQPTQFTPRLGRGSGEDFLPYGVTRETNEYDDDDQSLPPLFAPRLGRRLPWTPSPRLGRQLRSALRKM